MRNYIEQKIKDAQPIAATEAPSIQEESEQITDEPLIVSNKIENQIVNFGFFLLLLLQGATVLNVKTFTQGVSFEGYAFVNFGAPWCSHCQKLAPIWDRLAQKFSGIDEIRIARVDCTASESICRDYSVRILFIELNFDKSSFFFQLDSCISNFDFISLW